VPESEAVLDLYCGILGLGVIPGRVGVALAVDDDGLIRGLTLPRADRVRSGVLEQLRVDAVRRELDE
jgi:hypothetical protein